jgi:alkylation response protein AidB-like acyl-CoA dehydrogenase
MPAATPCDPHAGRARPRRVPPERHQGWITGGGEAQLYLVLAKTDPVAGARGVSAFVVEKDADGLGFGAPESKLGQHAAIATSVTFDDCFVADEQRARRRGQGFVMAMGSLDGGRIGIAAQPSASPGGARRRRGVRRRARGVRAADPRVPGRELPLADMATRSTRRGC